MPKRPTQEDRSRWFDGFGVFSYDGYADGGDANGFDDSLNQSNGLIAYTSGWRQQNHIHRIFFEEFRHFGSCLVFQRIDMVAVNMAHEADMPFGQGTDAAGCGHLFEAGNGKHDIDIFVGVAVIVVIVGDRVVVFYAGGIENAIRRVALGIGHVKCCLVSVV